MIIESNLSDKTIHKVMLYYWRNMNLLTHSDFDKVATWLKNKGYERHKVGYATKKVGGLVNEFLGMDEFNEISDCGLIFNKQDSYFDVFKDEIVMFKEDKFVGYSLSKIKKDKSVFVCKYKIAESVNLWDVGGV